MSSSLTTGSLFTNPLASSPGVLGLGGVGSLNMMGGNILGGGGGASSLPTIITTLYDKEGKTLNHTHLLYRSKHSFLIPFFILSR